MNLNQALSIYIGQGHRLGFQFSYQRGVVYFDLWQFGVCCAIGISIGGTGQFREKLDHFPNDFTDIEQNIKPGTIVIIGETHQEPESPRFFKRLVDSTIAKYQCLSIGLEIERSQQTTIDDVMAGRAPVSKIRIPFAVDHDGMRRMIEQFAELKRQSPCLKVEAIDADQDRDENMANRLADFPSDQPILVLLGGLHALKKVNWIVTSGKPAVAEILVHRGFQVKSYPQRWLPETCPGDQGRTSRFIGATEPEALPILNRTLTGW
ncbi:hypothetical protein [Methylomonas koyamae]|uniref:Uncharacterized protein n=1 Tax=Methylomonas koyamae TaxID=702114 RepID=A0AA91D8E5_9GAMM|nr:hypothetical protein [Methylomonas koyamae]OAI21244.1 hypothetical protein A1356_21260 [Methylomonas koyamae]